MKGLQKASNQSKSSTHKHDSDHAAHTPHAQRSVQPQPNVGLIAQRIRTQDPSDLSPGEVLQLQRTVGNHAVNQLLARQSGLARRVVQASLTVGAADDPYEREADRVAAQVMSASSAPSVSRQEDDQTAAPSITPLAQRASRPDQVVDMMGRFDAGVDIERQLSASSGGSPLPAKLRSELEPKFGANFNNVRVHTGAQSDQLNRKLGAQAFTHSNHIYMGAGKYNPGTGSGKQLLAHELTHVVQQSAVQTASVSRSTDGTAIQRWPWSKSSKTAVAKEPESPAKSSEAVGPSSQGEEPKALTEEQLEAIRAAVAELPPESVLQAKEKAREEVAKSARKQAEEEGLPVVKGKPNLARVIVASNGGEQQVKEAEDGESPAVQQPIAQPTATSESAPIVPTTGGRSGFRKAGALANTTSRIGAGGTGKIASLLGKIGSVAGSLAHSIAGIAGIVGAVFQALSAGLDMRAAHSSRKKHKALQEVLNDAKSRGVSRPVLDAISDAMKAKYKKFWTKVVTASVNIAGAVLTTTLLALGGFALLATNPVGWAIAGALALVGIGFFIYRVVKWFKKGSNRGQQRQKNAETLFNALVGSDKQVDRDTAKRAISELGLKSDEWLKQWNQATGQDQKNQLRNLAVGELMRKLKWS